MYSFKINARSPGMIIRADLREAEALRDALNLAISTHKEHGSSILVGTDVMLDDRFLEVRVNAKDDQP